RARWHERAREIQLDDGMPALGDAAHLACEAQRMALRVDVELALRRRHGAARECNGEVHLLDAGRHLEAGKQVRLTRRREIELRRENGVREHCAAADLLDGFYPHPVNAEFVSVNVWR